LNRSAIRPASLRVDGTCEGIKASISLASRCRFHQASIWQWKILAAAIVMARIEHTCSRRGITNLALREQLRWICMARLPGVKQLVGRTSSLRSHDEIAKIFSGTIFVRQISS